MAKAQEYQVLRIFEGKGFFGRTQPLPLNYYNQELLKLMNQEEADGWITDLVQKGFIELIGEHKSSKMTNAAYQYFDSTYFKEQAYDLVDTALKRLQHHNNSININHRSQRVHILADKLLDDNYLITYLSYPKQLAMVEMREEGHIVLEKGGIKKYLILKFGLDKSETQKIFQYLKDEAGSKNAITVNLESLGASFDLDLTEISGVLDDLEFKGLISQKSFISDEVRHITILDNMRPTSPTEMTIPSVVNNHFSGNITNSVIGSSNNVATNSTISDTGIVKVNVPDPAADTLTKMQLADFPKNIRARNLGILIGLFAIAVSIVIYYLSKGSPH